MFHAHGALPLSGPLAANAAGVDQEQQRGPVLMNGTRLAEQRAKELQAETTQFVERNGVKPGLAMVIVGNNNDSVTYVRMKRKMAEFVGYKNFDVQLPMDVSQEAIEAVVRSLNENPEVHGILVQNPLPFSLDPTGIWNEVSLVKDVDGSDERNQAKLAMRHVEPTHTPCTPMACLALLRHYQIPLAGRHCVVVGRSPAVGLPLSLMLNRENATVTLAHRHTNNVKAIVQTGEVVISCAGKPQMITADWVQPGATVIDVGNTRLGKGRVVGDVDFESVSTVAKAITPVPGGVGPMTIVSLMSNTLDAAKMYVEDGIRNDDDLETRRR